MCIWPLVFLKAWHASTSMNWGSKIGLSTAELLIIQLLQMEMYQTIMHLVKIMHLNAFGSEVPWMLHGTQLLEPLHELLPYGIFSLQCLPPPEDHLLTTWMVACCAQGTLMAMSRWIKCIHLTARRHCSPFCFIDSMLIPHYIICSMVEIWTIWEKTWGLYYHYYHYY